MARVNSKFYFHAAYSFSFAASLIGMKAILEPLSPGGRAGVIQTTSIFKENLWQTKN